MKDASLFQYVEKCLFLCLKGNKKGSKSIVYHVSQNRFFVRRTIQPVKFVDAQCSGFVPYFTDKYHE